MEDKYGRWCPRCGTEWKITCFNMKRWKDCTKCGLTAEEIVNKKKKNINHYPPEIPGNVIDEDDFEKYIEGLDWDDIFYYKRGV